MQPISIFMMDVTDSTHFDSPRELDNYLKQIVTWISQWTEGKVQARIKNRYGDEILFVSEHFFTSYVVAYFTKEIWRYDNHPPIFATTYGMIEDTLSMVGDIDTWNEPLFKNARNAMDKLKQQKRGRPWIRTEAENYLNHSLFSDMYTVVIDYQNQIFKTRSPQQRITSLLSTVFETQQEVASILKKTPANVSKLLNKSDSEKLIRMFHLIIDYYVQQESHVSHSDPNECLKICHSLVNSIKFHLSINFNSVFDINRTNTVDE